MSAITAASVPKRQGHSQENAKFANDGSLESVDLLLRKQAIKCFARVQALGLGMDYSDVLQEMYVSYVKARKSWSPEGGAMFSTYVTRACWNNFNNAIKKMELQRTIGKIEPGEQGIALTDDGQVKHQRVFGMVSECEFDMMEEEGYVAYLDTAEGPGSDSPSYRLEQSQEMLRKLATLSLSAKRLVAALLSVENNPNVQVTSLTKLALVANLRGDELKRVKLEIINTYGVKW